MNKIKSFCLGSSNGDALFFKNEEEFLEAIKEKIRDNEAMGNSYFDLTIEEGISEVSHD